MIHEQRIIVSNIEDQQLIHDWTSLWEASPVANYTNSPHWLIAALGAYQNKQHHIVAVYLGSRLDAIIAVVSDHRYGLNCLVRPGRFNCGTPVLSRQGVSALTYQALARQLSQLGTLVLEDVPIDTQQLFANSLSHVVVQDGGNNHSFIYSVQNLTALDSYRNHDLHRVKHKLDEFRFIFDAPHTAKTMQAVFTIDKNSAKAFAGYSTFVDQPTRNFFLNLVRDNHRSLKINFLFHHSHPEPIAYEIGFLVHGTYYGSQTAYNKNYKQYSPGKLLVHKLLEHLPRLQVQRVDFGSGDNEVKSKLANHSQQLYHLVASHNILLVYYLSYVRHLQDWAYNHLVNHALYKRYRMFKTKLLGSKNL